MLDSVALTNGMVATQRSDLRLTILPTSTKWYQDIKVILSNYEVLFCNAKRR